MASYNKVILVGNTTRDVELRQIPSGTSVCDLGLAVNDRRKDSTGAIIDETTFVDVTLWGATAAVAAEYARKGTPVLIEGRLKLDSWIPEDGKKRSKLKVIGERLVLLGSRNDSRGAAPQRQMGGTQAPSNFAEQMPSSFDPSDISSDSIPF